MRKKGLTLIEILIALSILSILIIMTYGFIFYNDRTYSRVSKSIDESINERIGLEFLVNQIAAADDIKLVILDGGVKKYVNSITIQNGSSPPRAYLEVNLEKIYIVGDILRNNTLSEQVVSGIKSFSVENRGNGLYSIAISSENENLSTLVYKRK